MRLTPNHAALSERRTIHVTMVTAPSNARRLLKSAADNDKLGKGRRAIVKGKWKGFPMYVLTLQERATCPTSCQRWRDCFGNGSTFAQRIDHTRDNFLPKLAAELAELSEKHPRGFVVRLHILGDFYSVPYVDFWRRALEAFPMLHIFGYTHRTASSAIGKAIRALRADAALGNRFAVRASDSPREAYSANVVKLAAADSKHGIVCPEQTWKTESCLTCGLCWSLPHTPIVFIDHDDLARQRSQRRKLAA